MFTGLIEEIGTVHRVVSGTEWGSIALRCAEVLHGTKISDSIAVNGVCRTVVSVSSEAFTVSIIPHTGAKTILLDKKMGDMVNLEMDIIAKYIRRFTSPPKKEKNSRLTLSCLQENGF